MVGFASLADSRAIEAEVPWGDRDLPNTVYQLLSRTAAAFGRERAISFQIESGPKSAAETLNWDEFQAQIAQAANLFRGLGIGPGDVVACIMPNCIETAAIMIGALTAGIVAPVNPLLDAEQIGAILNETSAKIAVTIRAFPKTDLPQKVSLALEAAPGVENVFEVDLLHYVSPPKSWIVPLIRPKNPALHGKPVLDFLAEARKQPRELQFEEPEEDRVGAYFLTGGTTGLPKIAQHRHSGMIYNGWLGARLLFKPGDNVICPLPLFHVFAFQVIMMSMVASGAHVVFPTPAGYRGDGVMDNFWKLIERWKITFIITVPTAIAALMQRPVNADISSIETAFSGSSPLPIELYKRFEKTTGVNIVEGYGLTEATCLVSCNPVDGEKRIGSVGIPFPYTDIRILQMDAKGHTVRSCTTDEVGEICVSNPGVFVGNTYTDPNRNVGLFADQHYLRTGDLGRLDADGYLYITGRAKDTIIRGGHNIDPAEIEEALAGHPAVAMAGAIGFPDVFAGELPCAFVELVKGATVSEEELMQFARENVHERAARPKYIEVLPELPKTAVGKVFKPELRKRAIARAFNEALTENGLNAQVSEVIEDKKRGLVAQLEATGEVDETAVAKVLGEFTRPFAWL